MAIPPIALSPARALRNRILGSTRLVILLVFNGLLAVCLVFAWITRDAMGNLSFLNTKVRRHRRERQKRRLSICVPGKPPRLWRRWRLPPKRRSIAHDAERLADHEVDQAFASALRQATLQAQHITLTGDALALSQKVAQFSN